MRQTWRWFGPQDLTSIDDMRQAGVEGVVSALHHVATGTVWTPEEIALRQAQIGRMKDGAPSHLKWEVVESLPVSEDIKRQTGDWKTHINHWKTSLTNLSRAGIEVVCYNFMPVLDWTRTDLAWRLDSGATCMRFDLIDFAAFDIYILQRADAAQSFPDDVVEAARERFDSMSEERREQLAANVVFGLPGTAETFSLADVRQHLAQYDNISAEKLRSHLFDFLSEVAPLAEELGVRICCHPDDPPFPLLGLPRIMSTESDYRQMIEAVNIPASGITLCTGSLGTRRDNDLPGMMQRLGDRVHFLHLRNVVIEEPGNYGSFYEAGHLEGGTDMVAMIAAILAEERRRKAAGRKDWQLPIRPDHGQDILDDLGRKGQPGYPSIGRLKGLAELRGIMTALEHPSFARDA
ncbi:mannonate dehydratase [Falsochrobactrum shanghaiense]|uniref:Mannonate dehydratase n=1 Tax=Falsochrobactrum shanghaiense TaxID=2201899 RepID=A0A316JC86_9HYPH|nr:mannonate dehydratase [Falsochrobactrum shanghaiense]PWL18285.1 mannonate dehydratase [Falsochrobactrum shanghaiense]